MRTYTVDFTDPALLDLEEIREHIGKENPSAASRVAVQIIALCDRLEYFPGRGRPGSVLGTRELTALRPYVIVYRVQETRIEVLRVWHSAQDRS